MAEIVVGPGLGVAVIRDLFQEQVIPSLQTHRRRTVAFRQTRLQDTQTTRERQVIHIELLLLGHLYHQRPDDVVGLRQGKQLLLHSLGGLAAQVGGLAGPTRSWWVFCSSYTLVGCSIWSVSLDGPQSSFSHSRIALVITAHVADERLRPWGVLIGRGSRPSAYYTTPWGSDLRRLQPSDSSGREPLSVHSWPSVRSEYRSLQTRQQDTAPP
jgi:hypothetical protein